MAITLFGIGGTGVLVLYFFHPQNLQALIHMPVSECLKSLGIGTVYAALCLPLMILILRTHWMQPTCGFFTQLMMAYRVRQIHIWGLSICAGVGEELLFRGSIQPFLGIWPTALVFVLLHGYLNPFNRPLFLYGILLTLISGGFGYLAEMFLLPAAIAAHVWIDVGLLYFLSSERVSIG